MTLNLPLHPSRRHPLTGEPLRAIAIHPKTGNPVWPIMGGSPEGDDDAAAAAAAATAKEKADADAAAAAAAEAEKEKAAKGFPENTPVAEMTAAQQAAYWKDKAQKHEGRATEYRTAAGGKTAAEVAADLKAADDLRKQNLSEQEKAVEAARLEGRTVAASEIGTAAARMAFEFALGHDPEKNDRTALIDTLDLTKVLTDTGTVDTAKVRAIAGQIAPADKGTGTDRQKLDFGGGNRGDSTGKSGVAAGAELYTSRKKSTQSTT